MLRRMEDSGLRGLGGAGFPTGRKWRIVMAEPAPRLMAVNLDEGEPGTFKDRVYLERDPHRFLEGMLIAAAVTQVTCNFTSAASSCNPASERFFSIFPARVTMAPMATPLKESGTDNSSKHSVLVARSFSSLRLS